ncbi:MAG: sulfotransferase family protein [Phyllobacterium sp.]
MQDDTEARTLEQSTPQGGRRTALVVLGMHRSGTSALTRIVSLLGATLPKNLLGAHLSNQTGHWEPEELIKLHDQMLVEGGSSWHDWRAFDIASLGEDRAAFYLNEIKRLIIEEYGSSELFVLKEPRICRFVPLLERALGELGIDVKYIVIQRNPLAVASSLNKRDGLPLDYAALLWLRHALDAEASTRGRTRVLLSYEDFLDDWEAAVRNIGDELAIDWPRKISEAEEDISKHLSRDFQHHRQTALELDASPFVAEWTRDAYKALIALEGDATHGKKALDRLQHIRMELERASQNLGNPVLSESRRVETILIDEIQSGKRVADQLRSDLDVTRNSLLEQEQTVAQLTQRCASLSEWQNKEIGRIHAERAARAQLRSAKPRLSRVYSWLSDFVSRKVLLHPLNHLKQVQRVGDVTTWEIIGNDPQFEFFWEGFRALRVGHYMLEMDLPNGAGELGQPRIYLETGSGFNDAESVLLSFRERAANRYFAVFPVPRPAFRVRFDPCDAAGNVSLGDVAIHKIPQGKYHRSLAS